jgi:hypothetical protein
MARTVVSLVLAFVVLFGGTAPVLSGPALAVQSPAAEAAACPPEARWLATPDGQVLAAPGCPPSGSAPAAAGLVGAGGTAPAPQAVEASGGPDEYGYTWDNGVPLNWIEAAGIGTAVTFGSNNSSGQYSGPISLPFSFQYYENTYTSLFIAASGYVGFTNTFNWPATLQMPNPSTPNNVIAPYAAPLLLNNTGASGRVYYLSGGTAPNRYFVVQWYQVMDSWTPAQNIYTYAVVLHENGNIEFKYHTMLYLATRWCGSGGIEDSAGTTGLVTTANCGTPQSGTAVRFTRPAPAARLSINPRYQGRFTSAGEVLSFTVPIRNVGQLGSDVFDVALSAGWPATVYAADGVTPLADTDFDGVMDTGTLAEGSTAALVVKVTTPGGAVLGDADSLLLTATSSINPLVSKTATLQSAVPAPFAQVYIENSDYAMTFALTHPDGQATKKATLPYQNGYDPAIASGSGGQLVYAWSRGRCPTAACSLYVNEIEYALLNAHGEVVRPVTRLADHSAVSVNTYDNQPAVAVTPDGRIGLLWYRYQYQGSTNQFNYNVFFAALDGNGSLAYGPVNLTNNPVWGTYNDLFVPQHFQPHIAATGDNRFVLAWQQFHYGNPTGTCSSYCAVDDVYYAIHGSTGTPLLGMTKYTADTAGNDDGYSGPNLATLASNRVLLSLYRQGNIYAAVLDSAGGTVLGLTDLTTGDAYFNYGPDAVQLSNGNILVAYTVGTLSSIGYAVLNPGYGLLAGSLSFANPAAPTGSYGVSAAADGAGHGILTWTDSDYNYRRGLYYALVNATGALLTQPMLFHTTPGAAPSLNTSFTGYGNTSYSTAPTAGVDAWVQGAPGLPAVPGHAAGVRVEYGNHGLDLATATVVSATVGGGLTLPIPGNTTTFNVADLGWLDTGVLNLVVNVPNDPVGTSYPITVTIGTAGSDANSVDNQVMFNLVSSNGLFVPIIRR